MRRLTEYVGKYPHGRPGKTYAEAIESTDVCRGEFEATACVERLAAYEDTGLEPDEIPHWIPVSERLPEVWKNESGEPLEFNVMLFGAKEAATLCFDGSQWFEFDWKNMRITGYYSVTHWIPLPQPPKGENS